MMASAYSHCSQNLTARSGDVCKEDMFIRAIYNAVNLFARFICNGYLSLKLCVVVTLSFSPKRKFMEVIFALMCISKPQ